jgi:HK97 family phage prohead protease
MSETLTGRAVVFNSPSQNLGGFREVIAPEALSRTLKEGTDLRALVEHDPGRLVGRMSSGTLKIAKTAKGLDVELRLPSTTDGEDLGELVRRRDLSGMSFSFMALVDDWRDGRDGPIRTVRDLVMREVSAVAWPAYVETTLTMMAAPLARSLSPGRPVTVSGRLREMAAVELRSEIGWSLAALKTGDGRLIAHDEGRRSLARYVEAKRKAGRRRPQDARGAPLVWRSELTLGGWRGAWVSPHLSIADAQRRHHDVAQMIKKEGSR